MLPAMLSSAATVACRLLSEQPVVPVMACPTVCAHVAPDVFDLWERWEAETQTRQEPPFWAVVWPGAALMASWLASHPEYVRGQRVVDVGCGSAVGAVAAAKAGAASVVANDLDPVSLAVAELTAGLNRVELRTRCDDLSTGSSQQMNIDVLLVCEMFYEAEASQRMTQWLDAERARGVRVLVADAGRPFLPRNRLQPLHHDQLATDVAVEGVASRVVTLYEWH